ncbi:MAG TPA: cell division ATP-binding protein FtsE [Myxococcales bacterium]|nr:cell division ATP-binding protein FtsE [Myxococcales bacterium]
MIQFFHVYKQYRDQPALTDVSLEVDKGEFVFLTGPSGAGKTTLLKLIFCAERAHRGQILVNGRNIARIRDSAVPYLRRNIGVVFQDFKLLPAASVFENVALTLQVLGRSGKEIRRKVMDMLEAVGLEHKAASSPQRLSGGEQQRVAIARALVNDPAILLADEPTGNLDPAMTLDIMNLLADVNARGTTVMVATHDQGLLERYQKRRLALTNGRVTEDGR